MGYCSYCTCICVLEHESTWKYAKLSKKSMTVLPSAASFWLQKLYNTCTVQLENELLYHGLNILVSRVVAELS